MALKSQRLSDTKPARSPLRPTARQAAGWAGRAPSPKGAPWPPESRAGSSSSQGGTPKALEGGMQPPPPLQQPDFPVTFLAGCAGSSRPCAGFRVCTGSAHGPGLPSAHPSVSSEASCTPRWCQGRQMCLLHAQNVCGHRQQAHGGQLPKLQNKGEEQVLLAAAAVLQCRRPRKGATPPFGYLLSLFILGGALGARSVTAGTRALCQQILEHGAGGFGVRPEARCKFCFTQCFNYYLGWLRITL